MKGNGTKERLKNGRQAGRIVRKGKGKRPL